MGTKRTFIKYSDLRGFKKFMHYQIPVCQDARTKSLQNAKVFSVIYRSNKCLVTGELFIGWFEFKNYFVPEATSYSRSVGLLEKKQSFALYRQLFGASKRKTAIRKESVIVFYTAKLYIVNSIHGSRRFEFFQVNV